MRRSWPSGSGAEPARSARRSGAESPRAVPRGAGSRARDVESSADGASSRQLRRFRRAQNSRTLVDQIGNPSHLFRRLRRVGTPNHYRCLLAIIPVIASKNGRVTMRVPRISPTTGGRGQAIRARLSSASERRARTEACVRPQRHGIRKRNSDGRLGQRLNIPRAS